MTSEGGMKAFISENEVEEVRKKRQEEWEKVRKPDDPLDKSSINGLPVLMCRSHGLTIKEILNIVVLKEFPLEKLSSRVPSLVDRTSVFVVDLSCVDPMDLAADDCGAYGAHSSPSVGVEASCDEDGVLTGSYRAVSKVEESLPCPSNKRRFIIRRQYSWHSMEKSYKRIITKVEENGELLSFAIVQYIIKTPVDVSKLFSKPHGGSKTNKDVYIRTKPSVLHKIRKLAEKQMPKQIIAEIEKDADDIQGISSQSDLPRDKNQIYSQVRRVRNHVKSRSTSPTASPEATDSYENQQAVTKKLSVELANCGVSSVSCGLLNQIWHQAEVILSYHYVLDVGNDVFCVTEYGTSANVSTKKGNLSCSCKNYESTAGLCQHTLAVGEKTGKLHEHLHYFNSNQNTSIPSSCTPKRAGETPKEKRKLLRENEVQSTLIVNEEDRVNDDIDFPKPILFTEIWHNSNPFAVLFTKTIKRKEIMCETCKIEFPRGTITCIPQDIVITHRERYDYRKEDEQGNAMEYESKKEDARFYCVRKSCILERHPYFWKGMLTLSKDTSKKLKEGHHKLLREEFHFFC